MTTQQLKIKDRLMNQFLEVLEITDIIVYFLVSDNRIRDIFDSPETSVSFINCVTRETSKVNLNYVQFMLNIGDWEIQ